MKNIKYLLFVVLLSGVMFSCQKGFLEEDVYDFRSNVNFYETPQDANSAMIGTYKFLADLYRQSMIEMLTQNSGAFVKHRLSTPWISGTYTSSTKEVTWTWQYSYQLINGCNDVILNVGKMENIDDSLRTIIVGEARFLRAWAYFDLVRLYRRVPIRLEPTNGIQNAMKPLSESQKVYDQVIIPDLQYAKAHLPKVWNGANKGRVTWGSATAALAKVYLTLAGNDEGSPYWAKARDEAKEVMESGIYSLLPDFGKLWDINNKNSDESIFEVQYLRGTATGSGYAKIFTPAGSRMAARGGGWGRSRCTQKNYDDFFLSYSNDSVVDYRIEKTFISKYIKYKNGNAKETPVYPTPKYKKEGWPYIKKWVDPEAPDNFAADNNFIVIRYADVLLMFAEAENEVNGPTAEAYDAVDELLARARHADGNEREVPANWERNLTKEQFRNKVWDERRFELAGELHLWFDLVRRGWDKFRQFKEDDNNYETNMLGDPAMKPVKHGVYEKNMYLPIPTLEISSNDSVSVADQNPGY